MKKLFLVLLTLSYSLLTFSQNYYSIAKGSWTDNISVWSNTQNGSPCSCSPGTSLSGSTAVYIYNNISSAPTTTGPGLSSLAGTASITIGPGDSAIISATSLSMSHHSVITVNGTLFIYAPLTMGNNASIVINSGGSVYIYGSVSLSGSATVTDNGSLTIHGNVNTSGSASFSGTGKSYVIGDINGPGTSFLSVLPDFFSSFATATGSGITQFQTNPLKFVPLQFNNDANSVLTGNGAFTPLGNLTVPNLTIDTAKVITILPLPGDSLVRIGKGGQILFQPLWGAGCYTNPFTHIVGCADKIMSTCGGLSFGGSPNFSTIRIGIGTVCTAATLDVEGTPIGGNGLVVGQGNVGIGTLSPAAVLDVEGATATNPGLIVQASPSNTGYGIIDYVDAINYQNTLAFAVINKSDGKHMVEMYSNGKIRGTEMKVCIGNGCDFVFDKDYSLMPLNELETYLNLHHHLPGIAAAKDMESDGIELGKMNTALLQKVEELTLYVIKQQKSIDELQAKVDELSKK